MSFKFNQNTFQHPSTPDKSKNQSLWSNLSTTPAGPPPSAANPFLPHGQAPPDALDSSQLNPHSHPDFGQSSNSLFTKSGGFKTNDSIFGSSIGSDFALPKTSRAPPARPLAPTPSQGRFGGTSTGRGAFGRSVTFEQQDDLNSSRMEEYEEYEEEGEDMEQGDETLDGEYEEDMEEDHPEEELDLNRREPSTRLSFLDSSYENPFSAPAPAPVTGLGQARKPIYSNPTEAKRPKLNEAWANRSPLRKTTLSPKKASAMPSIIQNMASRIRLASVDEPGDMIFGTEETLYRLYDVVNNEEMRHVDVDASLAHTVNRLVSSWDSCADRSGIARPYGFTTSIGPGEQAPPLVKASFLASLLLEIHHPSRGSAPIASNSNPLAHMAPNGMVKAIQRASVATPLPQILLDWLNANHASHAKDLQALRHVEPNSTASSNFWDIVNAAVLRGRFVEAADILRSADFNYARSALEDGLPQPGYRGIQLQNIQRCVNRALDILDSCPGFRDDDWDLTGNDWIDYRKNVLSAVHDLEEFAEGDERDQAELPSQNHRFQAINFGMGGFGQAPSQAQNGISFTQSARMAESRVPWTIYQSLRLLYRIILGDAAAIKNTAQDWVEATICLTAWWDGEDDEGTFRASTSSADFQRSRGARSHMRGVDRNLRDAYLRRLDLAFSSATNENSDDANFRVNTMNSLEVGLASVFEGNVQGVLRLLETWSLCITSAITEVAHIGGWLQDGGSQKVSGLNENDLMVLSYGQGNASSSLGLTRDEALRDYALGLYERGFVENESLKRDGWELALEVLSRMHDAVMMKKAVSEIVEKLPLDNLEQLDKLVILCSDLGLEEQGRKIAERFGDQTTDTSEKYGLALVSYARAHNRRKVRAVVELLISFSLVQSRAYPAAADMDEELRSLLQDPKTCLSTIASVNEEAARILQFYLSGYATLRRFYEIRDEALGLEEGQQPRFKPLARRRAAAKALAAVISSAADNIYGGLFDPDRDSAVQVDGLMALLGEALVFVNQPSPVLSISQQFTILSAIEDLETVTPRVYAQCEECFQSTLLSANTAGTTTSPPSPHSLLKKSVSALSASTFSIIGSDILGSARTQSASGSGHESPMNSGVLVPQPGDKGADSARGWDWRVGLPEGTRGEDVLRMLRLGLARGLSTGALGSV
ncbi:Uncharacterized protein PECH_007735 [Penicillium ucsense]|uniref:Nuclear pore complex protein Nup85 n=1 Tax=Penicillium ucsense TaxID=2839758 RepID=A0A8J8VZW5_9EURO|nr:Uncharacterized protein PECM_007869 [Penicillium ucsense]KAF7734725.1 Uncharacterized protein PECH_007735 [Penicillium ucsense]